VGADCGEESFVVCGWWCVWVCVSGVVVGSGGVIDVGYIGVVVMVVVMYVFF